MASIGRYDKRSPFWYAAFTDPLGRRLKKSTGQTSKTKAKEMAQTWQRASKEARQMRLTEARAREVVSELMRSIGGEGLRVFTLRQWFDQFVGGKLESRAAKTGTRHEQIKREFLEFLGRRADLNIAAITSRDIAAFRTRRQSLELAPATLNLDIIILSAAFNGAFRQGYIPVLSRATYIDSAGSAARILAMQKVQAFGGKFFLAGLDETMRSIFETSRLNQIFQIFPDVDAALAAIR